MTIRGRKMTKRGIATVLALLFILSYGTIKFVYGSVMNEPEPINTENEVHYVVEPSVLDNYKIVNVIVREGDTAWGIQSELTPGDDIEEILKALEDLQDVRMSELNVGNVVQFAIK